MERQRDRQTDRQRREIGKRLNVEGRDRFREKQIDRKREQH